MQYVNRKNEKILVRMALNAKTPRKTQAKNTSEKPGWISAGRIDAKPIKCNTLGMLIAVDRQNTLAKDDER